MGTANKVDEYEYQEICQNINSMISASGDINRMVTGRLGGLMDQIGSCWKGKAADFYEKKMETVYDKIYHTVSSINKTSTDMLECVNNLYLNQK